MQILTPLLTSATSLANPFPKFLTGNMRTMTEDEAREPRHRHVHSSLTSTSQDTETT